MDNLPMRKTLEKRGPFVMPKVGGVPKVRGGLAGALKRKFSPRPTLGTTQLLQNLIQQKLKTF